MSIGRPTAYVDLSGMTGAQIRALLGDSSTMWGRMFGWMVDGIGSGINLQKVLAFNEAIRTEIRGDRQQCWADGNFVGVTGRCVEDPAEGVAKALAQLNGDTSFDPDGVRKTRLEGYLAYHFYREWGEAVESGQGSDIQAVIDKYGQYSDVMGTNPFIGGMSFSMASNQDIFNRMILGDSDWGATIQFCTEDVTTNCVNPFDIRDLWEDVGRHVQIIFKGLEIPGLPEWLPIPGIMSLPTIGEIFDTVMGPFQEEADRQMQECMGQDDDGDGVPNSASYCIENRSITDIITGTISDAATGVIDKAGEEIRRILDGELEIPCADDPQACADKVQEVLGSIFEGVWNSADPTMPGIPDWVRAIIIAGEYGDEVIRGIETATNTDIDGDGTIGLTNEGCEAGEADFGNGCEPLCEYDQTIAASDPQCVQPLSEVEERCNAQGKVYDELNDECLEECKNAEYVVGADGNCGPDENDGTDDGTGPDCNGPRPGYDPSIDWRKAQAEWDASCRDTNCPQDGSLISDHIDNDCNQGLLSDGSDDTNDGTADDELCNGEKPPQTQNDKNYCFDQGYAPCPEGTEEYGNGRWYKAENCTPIAPTECDNGATVESECNQCPQGGIPAWHEDGDCRKPLVGKTCEDFGQRTDPETGFCLDLEDYCLKYSDDEDCAIPDDCENKAYAEDHPEECGTQTEDPVECDNGATVESGCEECPEGFEFNEQGICAQTYSCDDPNATVITSGPYAGACGPCKPGYVYDGAPERCVKDGCPEGQMMGEGGVCVNTPCPEGQSFCEDTGQCENIGDCPSDGDDGSSSSGGGFSGSSGGRSMFQPYSFAISADPQLLSKAEFPITDFLAGIFTNSTGGRNV